MQRSHVRRVAQSTGLSVLALAVAIAGCAGSTAGTGGSAGTSGIAGTSGTAGAAGTEAD